jgi:hypothetical protein
VSGLITELAARFWLSYLALEELRRNSNAKAAANIANAANKKSGDVKCKWNE